MKTITQIDVINKEGTHNIAYRKISGHLVIDNIDGTIYLRKDQPVAKEVIEGLYKEVTSGSPVFFVYKYTFSNGEFYYGRSKIGTRRFGEYSRYKENKELQDLMKREAGKFKKERILTTTNLMKAAYEEWKHIHNCGRFYGCLNKRVDYDWMTEGAASIRSYFNIGMELDPINARNLELVEQYRAILSDYNLIGCNTRKEELEMKQELKRLRREILGLAIEDIEEDE